MSTLLCIKGISRAEFVGHGKEHKLPIIHWSWVGCLMYKKMSIFMMDIQTLFPIKMKICNWKRWCYIQVINWVCTSGKGNSGHKIFTPFFSFHSDPVKNFHRWNFKSLVFGISSKPTLFISICNWLINPFVIKKCFNHD